MTAFISVSGMYCPPCTPIVLCSWLFSLPSAATRRIFVSSLTLSVSILLDRSSAYAPVRRASGRLLYPGPPARKYGFPPPRSATSQCVRSHRRRLLSKHPTAGIPLIVFSRSNPHTPSTRDCSTGAPVIPRRRSRYALFSLAVKLHRSISLRLPALRCARFVIDKPRPRPVCLGAKLRTQPRRLFLGHTASAVRKHKADIVRRAAFAADILHAGQAAEFELISLPPPGSRSASLPYRATASGIRPPAARVRPSLPQRSRVRRTGIRRFSATKTAPARHARASRAALFNRPRNQVAVYSRRPLPAHPCCSCRNATASSCVSTQREQAERVTDREISPQRVRIQQPTEQQYASAPNTFASELIFVHRKTRAAGEHRPPAVPHGRYRPEPRNHFDSVSTEKCSPRPPPRNCPAMPR